MDSLKCLLINLVRWIFNKNQDKILDSMNKIHHSREERFKEGTRKENKSYRWHEKNLDKE